MSSEEKNSSNSGESSFQAKLMIWKASESSSEENDLISLQPYQFEPEYSTDEERGDGKGATT